RVLTPDQPRGAGWSRWSLCRGARGGPRGRPCGDQRTLELRRQLPIDDKAPALLEGTDRRAGLRPEDAVYTETGSENLIESTLEPPERGAGVSSRRRPRACAKLREDLRHHRLLTRATVQQPHA